MLDLSIAQIASLIKNKKVSPVEVTEKILHEISKVNPTNNIFISVLNETAMTDAQLAEKEIMQGTYKGGLHGVPISIKDNISVKNIRRTSGSKIEEHYMSKEDAYAVKQLRSKGAIIIGKTNLDEYANHVVGENEYYGTIQHPIKEGYSVGGSSGGSAVSVAKNLSYASIGTDTTGSVRIPASSCGIVGMKPTYNLIPSMGVNPLSWTLDHVGILTKYSADLSYMLHAMTPGKRMQVDVKRDQHFSRESWSNLTIGVMEEFSQLIENDVQQQFNEVINQLKELGVKFKSIKVDKLAEMMNSQEVIIGAEFASTHQDYFNQHKDSYEAFNSEFIEYGLSITEGQYREALLQKEELKNAFSQIFSACDIIISPTLPIVPPKNSTNKIDWGTLEEDVLVTLSRFTGVFNVSGLPALSIPIGLSSEGLPIGIQIVGNHYEESQLIEIGSMLEEMYK